MARKSWFKTIHLPSFIIVFSLLLLFYFWRSADDAKERIEAGKYPMMEIRLNTETQASIWGQKIGANSDFIFMQDTKGQIQIIPISSKVERIIHHPTK